MRQAMERDPACRHKTRFQLATVLECAYGGTIIKGSCDGLDSGMGAQNGDILTGVH